MEDHHRILERLTRLKVYRRGDERAPHKPLLVLLALGQCARGAAKWLPYDWVHGRLEELLERFGPPRKVLHPEFPFWYLRSDGIWEIDREPELVERMGAAQQPTAALLMDLHAMGGFPDEIYRSLRRDPGLVGAVAAALLEAHFTDSYHDDILAAVGLDDATVAVQSPRDPRFRDQVLKAYEWRCAVCGFDVSLSSGSRRVYVGLEAAHIKWRQCNGPDAVTNGIAMCAVHHKVFDAGALTVTSGLRIKISERVTGSTGFEEWILGHHDQTLRSPQRDQYRPNPEYLDWHWREVFRKPPRESRHQPSRA